MRIDLTTIKEGETIELERSYDPCAEELEFDDLHYEGEIALKGNARRAQDALIVAGTLSGTCSLSCSRCLAAFSKHLREQFDFCFDITDKRELDISEELHEILIFLHKEKYLCSEHCKGLCAGCGVNLNEESCRCSERSPTPSFSQLKNWQQSKSKE